MNNLPEVRRKKLREILKEKNFVRAMEASTALAGLVVENAEAEGKTYDAMWLSSLCDSVLKGKPDNEVVDFGSRVKSVEELFEVTTKPLIFDGDTGGKTEHFVINVRTLERMGVSAVIIEDKKGLKQNSLLEAPEIHVLADKEEFADKIRQGKKALLTENFMIIARIESFIAGGDLADALERADAYVEAGADGIMIHTYKHDGTEILDFCSAFRKKYPKVPLVLVPTAYCHMTEEELRAAGANIIIYANHLLRSAYKSMSLTAKKILEDGRALEAGEELCVSMRELLGLIK